MQSLLLVDTISSASGITIEIVLWLLGTAGAIVAWVLVWQSRASAQAERRHEEGRKWAEATFMRKDLHRAEAEALCERLERIEKQIERTGRTLDAIYRHQRGIHGAGDAGRDFGEGADD